MSYFTNTVDVVGDEALTSSIIDRSITEIADNLVTSIAQYAFYSCSALTAVNFTAAMSIGDYAFRHCSQMTAVYFSAATRIGQYAFANCSALTTADFQSVTSVGNYAFRDCWKLTALILRSETMAKVLNVNTFNSTPIKSGTGYIYVPRALLSDTDSAKDYRRASTWSTFAAQFRALEDYTVDGTTTGALDETKI